MNLPIKTIIYFIAPKIIEILGDIVRKSVTSENLVGLREKLYGLACDVTGRTHFTWDDDLAAAFLEILYSSKKYAIWGDLLLDIVEEWVKASETSWDDAIILPGLKQFRDVAGIPDKEA